MLIVGITCYWIDPDFNLHEALLSFQEFQGLHDGEHIGEAMYNVLDTFNICEKFFCCTTDNAKNNPTGLKELAKLLLQNKGIRWKVNEHHIRCLCHILNICVQAFLKTYRVLELEGPAAIDLDLDDVDNLDTPEMRAAHQAARTPAARNAIKEASKLFQEAMKLVREIEKVRS